MSTILGMLSLLRQCYVPNSSDVLLDLLFMHTLARPLRHLAFPCRNNLISLKLLLLNDLLRDLGPRDPETRSARPKDQIHLVDRKTFRLRNLQKRPDTSHQHPACEEKPCPETERLEDVWQGFRHNELYSPLHKCRERATEVSERTGEDLGSENPGDAVEAEGPEDGVDHDHGDGHLATCGCGRGQLLACCKSGSWVADFDVSTHDPETDGAGDG